MGGWGQMRIGGRMRMGAQASPHTPFLAPWRFLLLRRSCCPGDVAESGLKRRRTVGLKGDVEEGSDPIAALTGRKAASDEANPYARRRVVLAWQSAERHVPRYSVPPREDDFNFPFNFTAVSQGAFGALCFLAADRESIESLTKTTGLSRCVTSPRRRRI